MIDLLSNRRRVAVLRLAAALTLAAAPTTALAAQSSASAQPQPRLHALLIAATDYQDAATSDLPSAAADAFLLARVMMDRGADAADVRVLTDGGPPDQLWGTHAEALAQAAATREEARALADRGVPTLGGPTRARIIDELDRLVRVAGRGEQVFIAMSGHGEQQTTDDRVQEPDGFTELFLPIDFSRGAPGVYDGAVLDQEIGQYVQTLLNNGVQVIFVGDFCHSEGGASGASARRSAGGRSDTRLLAGAIGTTDDGGAGRFTGFYAAPSLSQALAVLVPYWADVTAQRSHGALTFYLAAALQDPALSTMRDVVLRVERDINMSARFGTLRRRLPPPQFEGDFTAPLPGSGTGLAISLWQVSKPETLKNADGKVEVAELTLPAGALNGVEPGAVYALSQTRNGREHVVLYGRAEDVTATRAVLRPAAAGGLTEEAWKDLRREDGRVMDYPETFTARLFAPGAPQTVWVARPERPAQPTPAQAEALFDLDALYDVQTRGLEAAPDSVAVLPSFVRLVEPGAQGATLSLAFQGDELVLRDEAESGRGLAGMDLARALDRIRPQGEARRLTSLRASLVKGLTAAARFQRIRSAAMRVSDTTAGDGVSAFDGLGLTLYRHRPVGDEPCAQPWGEGAGAAAADAWAGVEGKPPGSVEIDPGDLSSPGGAQACDVFVIEVRNEGSRLVAQGVLGDAITDQWAAPCDRSDRRAVSPAVTYACAQPVWVGVVAFTSDSAIAPLRPIDATKEEEDSGARSLSRGGAVRYRYRLTSSDPDFLLRTDFMVMAARSPFRQEVPVQFSQLCQQPLKDAFVGPMRSGEQGPADTCGPIQNRFRGLRNDNRATAPVTVDGLFGLLTDDTGGDDSTRGDPGVQPVGGTAMRRLTLQVTPRPEGP